MLIHLIPATPLEVLTSLLVTIFALLAVIAYSLKRPEVTTALFLGLMLRVIAAVVHRFTSLNIEGRQDAVVMESRAWEWAAAGCGNLGGHFDPTQSYVHSWIVGNVYACTERMPLFFQSLNVLLATAAMIAVIATVDRLGGRQRAMVAAWMVAILPVWILYTTVPLREAWIHFGIGTTVYFLARWSQTEKPLYLLGAYFALALAAMFHGGMISCILALSIYVICYLGRSWSTSLSMLRATHTTIVLTAFLGIALGAVALRPDMLVVSSLGDLSDLSGQLETIEYRISARTAGTLAYPESLIPTSSLDLLRVIPVRFFLFFTGPPPWQISSASHLIVWVDATLFLAGAYLAARNWRLLIRRRALILIALILLAGTMSFAIGSSNFTTSMRHRAKFAGLMIILVVMLLPERWLVRLPKVP